MKVFGIGLNKTVTKTLGECMCTFGLLNYSYDLKLLEDFFNNNLDTIYRYSKKSPVASLDFFNNNLDTIYKINDAYDSFEDWPWPLLFKEMDPKYADAKFVLTMRKDAETWFNSLCKHAVRTGPTLSKFLVYGHQMPHQTPEHHLAYYLRHAAKVREYFNGRPGKLIEVCWETSSAWSTLSEFLGLPVPEIPFPHKNKSKH